MARRAGVTGCRSRPQKALICRACGGRVPMAGCAGWVVVTTMWPRFCGRDRLTRPLPSSGGAFAGPAGPQPSQPHLRMRPRMLVSPYGCRPRGQVVVPRKVVWHPPQAARLSGAESGEGRYATDPVRVLCVREPRSRPSRPDLPPLPQRDDRHEIPPTADRHVSRLRIEHDIEDAMKQQPPNRDSDRSRASAARPGFAGHQVLRCLAQKRQTMGDEIATCRCHVGSRDPGLARRCGGRISRLMPAPRIRRHDVPRLPRVLDGRVSGVLR